jgi:hypothetical protein
MTLWHLLVGICFAMPIMAAIDTARQAKVHIVGYVLAITIALVMGSGFAWIMWATGRAVGTKIEQRSVLWQKWCFRGLYFAALLWIVVAGVVAQQVLLIALRQ